MPMSAWPADIAQRLRRLARDTGGAAPLEFALLLPLLAMLGAGLIDIGRATYQANQVEKAIRAAALYAARSPQPLSGAVIAAAVNLARTGTLDGSGAYLVSGWGREGASVSLTTGTYRMDELDVPVIRISATVPFDPMMPGVAGIVGIRDGRIVLEHEQAHVGD